MKARIRGDRLQIFPDGRQIIHPVTSFTSRECRSISVTLVQHRLVSGKILAGTEIPKGSKTVYFC